MIAAWYSSSALPGNGGILAVKNENHAKYQRTTPTATTTARLAALPR